MTSFTRLPGTQTGVVLLEALVAILIFSVGILALVGLQATAVQQATDARLRAEAAVLANELIAEMWVSNRDPAVLGPDFETGGPRYAAWAQRVAATLPGGIAPTVTVDAAGTELAGRVSIMLEWRPPNQLAGAAPHNYLSTAMIR